jgi:ubiquinone/menaquinone biosynthesis C-methylase UbiE
VAEDYNRVRPGPPDDALDWLVPPGCEVAVDLAAGTGLFSRALRRRVGEVIAVEPDDRMRAVLADRSPGVRAVAGRGEAIPLPDASVDAVFVSSAWHWLDHDVAVPEIARVLRDGGRLGVLWTSRDRNEGWIAELDALRDARPRTEPRRRRGREVTLPAGAPFDNTATAVFPWVRTMTVDDAVDWIGTYSGIITAPEQERAADLARAREVLLGRADDHAMVRIPVRSACWRADRLPR